MERPFDNDMQVDHYSIRSKMTIKGRRSAKWGMKIALWSARFFKFVYFMCHSHVTGPKSQSNCIISGMCGPPGFYFLFIFPQMGPKSVVHPVLMSHKQIWKTRWTTCNFHALFGRSSTFYGHFCADAVTSELSTHIPSSSSLYSWYNN